MVILLLKKLPSFMLRLVLAGAAAAHLGNKDTVVLISDSPVSRNRAWWDE